MPRGESKAWPGTEFNTGPIAEAMEQFKRSIHLLEDKEIRCTESPWVHGISYATSTDGVTCVECLRKAAADLRETINGLRLDLEMGRKGEFPEKELTHLWFEGRVACGIPEMPRGQKPASTGAVHGANCVECLRVQIFRERELRRNSLPLDDEIMGLLTAYEIHIWNLAEATARQALTPLSNKHEKLKGKMHTKACRLTEERDKLIRRLRGEE